MKGFHFLCRGICDEALVNLGFASNYPRLLGPFKRSNRFGRLKTPNQNFFYSIIVSEKHEHVISRVFIMIERSHLLCIF